MSEGLPSTGGTPRPGLRLARSIRFRIAVAFVGAMVAMAGVQAWLIAQQGPVYDSLELVAEGYLPLSKQVARLKRDQDRVQRDLARLAQDRPRPVMGETTTAEIYTQELADNLGIATILAQGMRARVTDPTEQAVLTKTLTYLGTIDSLFARYESQSAAFVEAVQEEASGVVRERLRRPLPTTAKQLSEAFDKLELALDARITAVTEATRQQQARSTVLAVGLTLVALGVAMVWLVMAFLALAPIRQLTAEVQRLASGESGARVEVGGDDEVGLLAAEFNQMAHAIELRDRSLKERAIELDRLSRYLASVLDSLDDALVVVEGGIVTVVNPAARQVWGAEDHAPPPEELLSYLEPGRHLLDGPDGTHHVVQAVPFGDRGVVAVVSDVTEQTRAQEALARSERLALVGQMLAQITHEVRNPLNALSLNAELLGDEVTRLDPDGKTEAADLLDMITGEVDRLTAVTGHYLQLARRPRAEPAPSDVCQVVEEVARLLEPELVARGVRLTVRLGDVPPQLLDGSQLRQALLNVVRNAVEAGGAKLVLSADTVGGEVVVALADDGPGMNAEELAHATDPFFSTKAQGTGLGLAITRQILEDHGGRVELASEPGVGLVVQLVLPARPAAGTESLRDDEIA